MYRQIALIALRASLGRYAGKQRNLLIGLGLFAVLVGFGLLALFEGTDLSGLASQLSSAVAVSAAVMIGGLLCVSVAFTTDIRTTSGRLAATLVTWPLPNAVVWVGVLVPLAVTTTLALLMLLPSASLAITVMLGTERTAAVAATLTLTALQGAAMGFLLAIAGVGVRQRLARAREAQKVGEIALAIAYFAPGYWIAVSHGSGLSEAAAAALALLWPGLAVATLESLGAGAVLVALFSVVAWALALAAVATRVAPLEETSRSGARQRDSRPGRPFSGARFPELKLVMLRALRNTSPRAVLLFWLLTTTGGVVGILVADTGGRVFLDLFFLAGLIVTTLALTIRGLSERHRPDELVLGLDPVRWVLAQVVACLALAGIASAPALAVLLAATGDVPLALACASLVVVATLIGTVFATALAPAPDDAIGTFAGILGYLLIIFVLGLLAENVAGIDDPLRVAFLMLAASPLAVVADVVMERRRWLLDTGAARSARLAAEG